MKKRSDLVHAYHYKDCFDIERLVQIYTESCEIAVTSKNMTTAENRYDLALEAHYQLLDVGVDWDREKSIVKSTNDMVEIFPDYKCYTTAEQFLRKAIKLKSKNAKLKYLNKAEILLGNHSFKDAYKTEVQQLKLTILDLLSHIETAKPSKNIAAKRKKNATSLQQKGILGKSLDDVEYCIFDLETTGLSPDFDAILEIALIRMTSSGETINEFTSLVYPNQQVRATEIHGITNEDVRDAPALMDISGHISRLVSGAIPVAYNAYFDIPFVNEGLFRNVGDNSTDYPYICSMYMRGLIGHEFTRVKLTEACFDEGISLKNAHSALADTRAVQKLFTKYLQKAKLNGIETFSDFNKTKKNYKFMKTWSRPIKIFDQETHSLCFDKPKPRANIVAEPQAKKNSSSNQISFKA